MKKTQVVMLLAVVAMVAMTASAAKTVVLSETWAGMEGIQAQLGAFDSAKNHDGLETFPYQYEYEAYAVKAGDAMGWGRARPGGDGYSMMLDANATGVSTGYGSHYGVRGGMGYKIKGAASTEAVLFAGGTATITANNHFTVEQYVYWPTATHATYGSTYKCNDGGQKMGPKWVNNNITFQDDDNVTYAWPQSTQTGVGAWFILRKNAPVYDEWYKDLDDPEGGPYTGGFCGCVEAPAYDGELIRMRVATSENAGTADVFGTYVDTYMPCAEWVRLKISHDLDNGIARAFGWKEDGTPLPWSGTTVAIENNGAPQTTGLIGTAAGEDPYMRGPFYIDDYEMSSESTGFVAGDMTGDEFVGQADLNVILGAWGETYNPMPDPTLQGTYTEITPLGGWKAPGYPGDPTMNGFVGQADLNVVLGDWGSGPGPVPEPATMSLLILGGLGVLVRRRRRA